jgi:transketolase N-terminal domain/subunit/transketolase C-terminal domain/subunit
MLKLLEVKDSDIRILTLEQGQDAVDRGIHIGGAMSAVIPMVTLYYGGIIQIDVENPTRIGQDLFILSKGHAIASLASIYAELGYFDRSVLKNSRSLESILNGHPGPLLPGIHVPTGPLGQGLSVAQGLALLGKDSPNFDVFVMMGDGELQEGTVWEGVMHSAARNLDNLCVVVDKNEGQLDDPTKTAFPMPDVEQWFESFGFRVFGVDGTQYAPVWDALNGFKYGIRDGRPTAIVSHNRKGSGGLSQFMIKHKAVLTDEVLAHELQLQRQLRDGRADEFIGLYNGLSTDAQGEEVRIRLVETARNMNLEIALEKGKATKVARIVCPVKTKPAPPRDKRIRYDPDELPQIDRSKEHAASSIVTMGMKVFAKDRRVVSIDADLGTTSGLQAGIAWVDRRRAHNVGVAEANMMCIGEAYAVMGYNAWVSTFCPFFNLQVMRRIAIGHQERMQTMEMQDGWLTEGYGLDLTFLATAPNFETKTNGATHMGNDDIQIFNGIAHLKIIDVSCPYQLLGVMKWIMEGEKSLVYVRIMRAPSSVIYDVDFTFEYGKGYVLKKSKDDRAVLISSGRGVHEALGAARLLEEIGIKIMIVDMPSVDETLMIELYETGKPVFVAEQNNGYIWREYQKALFKHSKPIDPTRLIGINTLNRDGKSQFIHSGMYEQLVDHFGLSPTKLAKFIKRLV